MPKYEIDISAWLIVEAKDADEAFAIGHSAIADIRHDFAEFDGEVAGVSESEG